VASLSSDPITDLSAGEKTTFVDATPANFPVNDGGTTLTHTDESLTSSNHPDGQFITTADAIYGGVDMAPTPAIPADILLETFSGEVKIWTMNGLNFNGAIQLITPGNGWFVITKGDFNGDGHADLLWQNLFSGQPAIWTTSNLAVTGGAALSNPGTAWNVVDAADFNGDGKADILWQNDNGQPAIWTDERLHRHRRSGAEQSRSCVARRWHGRRQSRRQGRYPVAERQPPAGDLDHGRRHRHRRNGGGQSWQRLVLALAGC